jgi:hypothetical protein
VINVEKYKPTIQKNFSNPKNNTNDVAKSFRFCLPSPLSTIYSPSVWNLKRECGLCLAPCVKKHCAYTAWSVMSHKELNVRCSRHVLAGTALWLVQGAIGSQNADCDHNQIQTTLLSLCNRTANFTHATMTHWRWVCHTWKYNTINYTVRIMVNRSRPQWCIVLLSDWWNTSENKIDICKYNSKYLTGLEKKTQCSTM